MIPVNLPDEVIRIELTMPALVAQSLHPSVTGFCVVAFRQEHGVAEPLMIVTTEALHPLRLAVMLERAGNFPFLHRDGDASFGAQARVGDQGAGKDGGP